MMDSTTAYFISSIKPATRNILVVGATTDAGVAQLGSILKKAVPQTVLTLYRPHRSGDAPDVFDEIIPAEEPGVVPAQLSRVGSFDVVILAIAHVMHADYKALVAACCQCAPCVYLYSTQGLQPLDKRDAESLWPEPLKTSIPSCVRNKPESWLFFRSSDQTVIQQATQLEREGATVYRVQTLAAFEQLIDQVDAVFYDWCLTDYGVLRAALEMAVQVQAQQEMFFALDLMDLAEDYAMQEHLRSFNQSVMPLFHHVYPLWTRPFLVERYGLKEGVFTLTANIPDPDIWTQRHPRPEPEQQAPIRFAYHGLFYFWHEVFEFMPVFQQICERRDATFDLFGRVHDSIDVGGQSLFPKTEKLIKTAFLECETLPGVTMHGFTPPDEVRNFLADVDYYVGITQGATLMSDTEMRTGVEEALSLGCKILHKETSAIKTAGLVAGKQYVPPDATFLNLITA